MKSEEVRDLFLTYFQNRNHTIVPSSSLIPTDPSVLLTTAGMQQFKPYFLGELNPLSDFKSLNTVSIQKCFRTSDYEEVGDESHLTFFEMLGNFSFGGYFKKEAIDYAYDFIKNILKLEIDYVTVFDPSKVEENDWRKDVPFDEEAYYYWQKYLPKEKIIKAGIDNFWGPTGKEGPCGPTTEIYVNNLEIWNLVFNQYYCDSEKKLTPLKILGVDTGMGFERLLKVLQNKPTIFETDLFEPFLELDNHNLNIKTKRILKDHLRGIVFLLSDLIEPSNKERGYILRKLIRRVIVYFKKDLKILALKENIFNFVEKLILKYQSFYPNLQTNKEFIFENLEKEIDLFDQTLNKGLKEFENYLLKNFKEEEWAEIAFNLYQSYGFPLEIVEEELKTRNYLKEEKSFKDKLNSLIEKHKELSKIGQEKKFGGHGLILDTGELKAKDELELKKIIRLHTATHLLHQALRQILGEEVKQMGSDITAERTRFDFSFSRKLTLDEIKKVEDLVNLKIKENLPVKFIELEKEEAMKTGALHYFNKKYPDKVKVYYIGDSLENAFSKEFCGGPHVSFTGEIGHFKIIKEEASSKGVRRIRAIVYD